MFSMYFHVLGLKFDLVTELTISFRVAFEVFVLKSHKLYLIWDYNFRVCVIELYDILRLHTSINE